MERQQVQWPYVLATTLALAAACLLRAVLQKDPEVADDTKRIRYSPLETPQTIRLIHVRRSRTDGNIIIQMKHVSLGHTRFTRTPFTAISYCWGEEVMHEKEVMINGRSCQVQASVYPILCLICDNPDVHKDSWFWIDYLCIDQRSPREKSAQVKLMGKLYETAQRTLVWLGEGTPKVHGQHSALGILKCLALVSSKIRKKNRKEKRKEKCAETRTETLAEKCKEESKTISMSNDDEKVLRKFWKRPWWTRVWTLQEFWLPKRLVFYLGDESISRRDWHNAVTLIRKILKAKVQNSAVDLDDTSMDHESPATGFDDIPMDDIGFGNQWAWRRLLQWKKSPMPVGLIALMAYMGHHGASKAQDRVYALLGICSAADCAIVGDPDYTISVEEVYTRLVVNWIRRHQSLNIVCFGALFTNLRSEEPTGLPSWVPDFRCWSHAASRPVPSMVGEPSRNEIGNFRPFKNRKHGVVDPNLVYDASAGLVAEFSKDDHSEVQSGRRLPCKGIFLDFIDGLGPVREYKPDGTLRVYSSSTFVQSTSPNNTEPRDGDGDAGKLTGGNAVHYDVSQHLVRCLSLDRAGRYLMWPAPVEDYVNQLRERRQNPTSSPQDHLDEFIAHNRELCILGATLDKHLEDLASQPHAFETPDGVWRSFAEASKMTAGDRSWDCRLITTDQGRLGMAPKQAKRGDVVAVLIGCSVPVVIRWSTELDGYKVVGEAFMPDYMQGEAIHQELERKDMILV